MRLAQNTYFMPTLLTPMSESLITNGVKTGLNPFHKSYTKTQPNPLADLQPKISKDYAKELSN